MPQYFKLRKKVAAGRPIRDQPDRLERAQGRRAAALDQARRARRLRDRERLPALAHRRARVSSGQDSRRRRHGRAARARGALRRRAPTRGRAFFVELAAKHVAISRGLGFDGVYMGGHMPASRFGEILERADAFAPDDWRGFARELQFAFPDEFYFFERDAETGLVLGRGEHDVPRVEAQAPHRFARAGQVPVQPSSAHDRLRRRCAALPGRPRALPCRRACSEAGREGRARARAGGEGDDVQVPATAATARCPTSPTSAPSRSAPRTSATGRAAARATGSARSTTRSASGRRRTSG